MFHLLCQVVFALRAGALGLSYCHNIHTFFVWHVALARAKQNVPIRRQLINHDFIKTGICNSSGSKPSFVCLACADDHGHSSGAFTSPARTGLYSLYIELRDELLFHSISFCQSHHRLARNETSSYLRRQCNNSDKFAGQLL